MSNKHLADRDWIPLIPLLETMLRKAKGNEHCDILESLFEYAQGNYDTADRFKKRVRRKFWKDIDTYRLFIDQCCEVNIYAEQDT